MDSQNVGKIISAVKDIFLAAIGATVFIFGMVHSVPITTQAVEYVGLFASYYGVHVYSSSIINKSGTTITQAPAQKP